MSEQCMRRGGCFYYAEWMERRFVSQDQTELGQLDEMLAGPDICPITDHSRTMYGACGVLRAARVIVDMERDAGQVPTTFTSEHMQRFFYGDAVSDTQA